VVTADAVAVANPAAAAPAAAASTTPAADKATAPLAIATAAIAASASLAGETVPASPASEGAGTDTTPSAAANTKTDGTKINAQGAVGQAVSSAVTPADTTVTTGIANAASVIAATPAGSKPTAQLKNPVVAKEGATTVGEQDGATDATDAPTTAIPVVDAGAPAVTPQTGAAGKPKADNGMVEAVKTDASGNSVSPSAVHTGAHSAAADIGQTLANSSGNGLQAPGAIQTQQTSAAPATAQLTATAANGAAVPLSGLAMEIAASANSGKTRFEIRLDPAELGRIDVRIDIDRHGQVTSHLTVERPETLSMLRQDANQLQRALDNAGLSTGNSGLQFSLRDQSSQGQNDGNQSNPNAHRLVVSEDDTVPAVVAGRSYGRMLGSSSGVDIRV
jgi:chemotaxis protein MotD